MSGSSQQFGYQMGQTLITIGSSSTVQVLPPRTTMGMLVKYQSGGSLAIVNAVGSTLGSGDLLITNERIQLQGPMTFFLAAGATSIASVLFKYSSGFSQLP